MRTRWQLRESGRHVEYGSGDIGQLELAWAITVHKAQGSEYPVIVLPLCMEHGPTLRRKLLYTALTRARVFVLLVGSADAIEAAVQTVNDFKDGSNRFSGLLRRLETPT